jgi:DNA polymerase-1
MCSSLKSKSHSGDPNLISLFQRNSDIYVDIASAVLCKNPSTVTNNERTQFKTVVLGIIYGIGPKALSSKLSLSVTECQQLIQKFLAKFPQIQEFMTKSITQAQRRGYVHTIHGRRRLLEDIKSTDSAKRSYAERQSVNTIIQGSAADITKATMIRTYEYLRERKLFPEKSRLILQLHDELYAKRFTFEYFLMHFRVFEVSDSMVNEVACQIEAEISKVCFDLVKVDMPVKILTGKRWGDLKPLTIAPHAQESESSNPGAR